MRQKNIVPKKKIAFFIPNFLIGGAENVFVNLANCAAHNYHVEIIVANSDGPLKKKLSKKIKIVNFNKKKILSCVFNISQYMKKYQPDYFLSAMTHCNIITCIAKIISDFKGKILIKECNNLNLKYKNNILKKILISFLIKIFYNFSHKIICLSNGICYDFKKIFPELKEKIHVVYNPINIKNIKLLAKEKLNLNNNIKKKFRIISVGRLVKQKNYLNLLKAFNLVQKKYSNYHLMLVGDGPEKQTLTNYVINNNLNKKITFYGEKSNPYKFLKNANMFVMSSNYEGFGTVLVEAMVLKLPIVSTNCNYGPKEILKNYSKKKLVKVNCFNSLAKAIIQLSEDKTKVIAKDNLAKYEIKSILNNYLN